MPENWKTYKLGDLASLGDGAHSKVKRLDKGVMYLTSKNLKKGRLNLDKVDYISKEDYEKLFNNKSKAINKPSIGDLLMGIIGTLGNVYLYKENDDFGISSSIAIIRPKKDRIISGYLYYYINGKEFKHYQNAHNGASAQGYTNLPSLRSIPVQIPPLQEQKSIASILSALDDKIELNLQMNKTLEEMAMALYKHWFVDFGPFQNGEFVATELGEIPKGWEVKQLKDIASLIMGQSPKSEFYNDSKEGLPFHQGVKDYGIRFPTDITYSTAGNREAAKGDILFSVRAPVGRLNVAKNKIILGRGLAAIRMPKFNSFLFYALKRMFVTEDSIGSGTVFNSVNKSDLQNLKFVLPPENQLLNFKELVDPLDQQNLNNSTENQTLTQLRDTLLPKLISGEVRVKDVEKTLSEVL